MEPCPFCLSSDLSVGRFFTDKWYTQVSCNKCGANGPRISNSRRSPETCELLAIEDWNTR
jgi:Lar family restriction alleviation protein